MRIAIVAAVSFLVFHYLTPPFCIDGESMAPTYRSGGLTLGWQPAYTFAEPRRGDIVIIRMAGDRVTLLKRIVALPGEEIEFRNGKVFIDGRKLEEPYVKKKGDWNLESRTVEEGHYYVIGDNRSGRMEEHVFGQVERSRIIATPLW